MPGKLLTRKRFMKMGRAAGGPQVPEANRCSEACTAKQPTGCAAEHPRVVRGAIHRNSRECGTTESCTFTIKDRNPANNDPVNANGGKELPLKLHWPSDREYRVQRIRESVGAVMNRRYRWERVLEAMHPRLIELKNGKPKTSSDSVPDDGLAPPAG